MVITKENVKYWLPILKALHEDEFVEIFNGHEWYSTDSIAISNNPTDYRKVPPTIREGYTYETNNGVEVEITSYDEHKDVYIGWVSETEILAYTKYGKCLNLDLGMNLKLA